MRKTVKGVKDNKNPAYYSQIGLNLAKKKTIKAGLISDILTKPGNKFVQNPRLKQMNSTNKLVVAGKIKTIKPISVK